MQPGGRMSSAGCIKLSLTRFLSADPATSHTTSFESNTEPLLNDDQPVRWPPHLLQLPSYESRRQTYKNVLTSRLRRKEGASTFQPLVIENSSFDSMDTVDTEGSSTDASRLEQVCEISDGPFTTFSCKVDLRSRSSNFNKSLLFFCNKHMDQLH